jgi:uncharacterized glyoxalase superfamily protein PhnB
MYQRVAPILLVDNVDEAVAWYQDKRGAEIQAADPKSPPFEWASLLLGGIEIMVGQKRAAQGWYTDHITVSETPANFIAYIYVEDAHDLYHRIKGRVNIVMEPTDQRYGIREFAIGDPYGFVLVFAQIIE